MIRNAFEHDVGESHVPQTAHAIEKVVQAVAHVLDRIGLCAQSKGPVERQVQIRAHTDASGLNDSIAADAGVGNVLVVAVIDRGGNGGLGATAAPFLRLGRGLAGGPAMAVGIFRAGVHDHIAGRGDVHVRADAGVGGIAAVGVGHRRTDVKRQGIAGGRAILVEAGIALVGQSVTHAGISGADPTLTRLHVFAAGGQGRGFVAFGSGTGGHRDVAPGIGGCNGRTGIERRVGYHGLFADRAGNADRTTGLAGGCNSLGGKLVLVVGGDVQALTADRAIHRRVCLHRRLRPRNRGSEQLILVGFRIDLDVQLVLGVGHHVDIPVSSHAGTIEDMGGGLAVHAAVHGADHERQAGNRISVLVGGLADRRGVGGRAGIGGAGKADVASSLDRSGNAYVGCRRGAHVAQVAQLVAGGQVGVHRGILKSLVGQRGGILEQVAGLFGQQIELARVLFRRREVGMGRGGGRGANQAPAVFAGSGILCPVRRRCLQCTADVHRGMRARVTNLHAIIIAGDQADGVAVLDQGRGGGSFHVDRRAQQVIVAAIALHVDRAAGINGGGAHAYRAVGIDFAGNADHVVVACGRAIYTRFGQRLLALEQDVEVFAGEIQRSTVVEQRLHEIRRGRTQRQRADIENRSGAHHDAVRIGEIHTAANGGSLRADVAVQRAPEMGLAVPHQVDQLMGAARHVQVDRVSRGQVELAERIERGFTGGGSRGDLVVARTRTGRVHRRLGRVGRVHRDGGVGGLGHAGCDTQRGKQGSRYRVQAQAMLPRARGRGTARPALTR